MNLYKTIDFAFWSNIHCLPRFFVGFHQLRELKRTVNIAYAKSSFYRKFFQEYGVLPRDIKILKDIRRLPITSKQLFLQFPIKEVMDTSFPSTSIAWRETSGSTGEPFRFPSSSVNYIFTKFGIASRGFHLTLFLKWKGISSKYAFRHMKIAELRVHNQPRFCHFLHIPVSDLRENPENVVNRLKEFGPDVVNSRATVLVELARFCSKFPANKRPRIDYIISHGEMLSRIQRKYIKDILGTEPYNRYGLEEVGSVAIDCERHSGLHIHEESYIIEILDENGNPMPDGKPGRIVLTFFYNDVLPLIRYDTGDQGFIISEPCECGVWARRIFVEGRRGGFLTIGSRKFNNVEFEVFLTECSKNILRYQVAKIDARRIEIRVIPTSDSFSAEAIELQNKFYQSFGIQPDIRVVDGIGYNTSGKARFIVDESQTDS